MAPCLRHLMPKGASQVPNIAIVIEFEYTLAIYNSRLLEARLRALLRRRFTQTDTRMSHGELLIDTALKTAYIKGNLMELTRWSASLVKGA